MAESSSITLRLGGSLALLAGASREILLGEGQTLAEIAIGVGISPGLVMLYSVNGTLRPAEYSPMAGDVVLLIPAVAGG